MRREILVQNIEKVHQPRRNILWRAQVGSKRMSVVDVAACGISDTQEAGALEWFFGEWIVPDNIVGKVVKNFHGQEEAGRSLIDVPLASLNRGQSGRDFNDAEAGASVDFRIRLTNVVEDVHHQSSVSGTHFVDEKVVVTSDGFTIVWAEEFCRIVVPLTIFAVEGLFVG
ncbi:DUF185-domain-containing protein, partial [Aureobasidium melanogenum]